MRILVFLLLSVQVNFSDLDFSLHSRRYVASMSQLEFFYTMLKAFFSDTVDSITIYQNLLVFIIRNASC